MRALDGWAATRRPNLFGLVGLDGYRPRHFRHVETLEAAGLESILDQTALLVSDTNIELLIAAQERGIPMVVMPRLSIFGEDVGLVQAKLGERAAALRGVMLAPDEDSLVGHLDRQLRDGIRPINPSPPDLSELVAVIIGSVHHDYRRTR